MSAANPWWGAPRIHGELAKPGITVSEDGSAFLLPDRDRNYGRVFRQTAAGLGIEEVLCAPRSLWQTTHRFLARFRRPNSAEWWSCPKSVGYTPYERRAA